MSAHRRASVATFAAFALALAGSDGAPPRATEVASSVELRREPIEPLPTTEEVKMTLDARKVALGGRLFFDTRLSGDGTLSCASCHDVPSGGDDETNTRPASAANAARSTRRRC